MSYHHKGDGEILAAVVDRMGLEGRAVNTSEVRRIAPYARLTNLLGQAARAKDEHQAGILAEAHKSYYTLYAAFRAAAELLNHAHFQCGGALPDADPGLEPADEPDAVDSVAAGPIPRG